MSIFTKFLNEETSQKFTQVKDGKYKAQIKDIALEVYQSFIRQISCFGSQCEYDSKLG